MQYENFHKKVIDFTIGNTYVYDNIQLRPSDCWIFTDSEDRNCFIIPNKQLKYTV